MKDTTCLARELCRLLCGSKQLNSLLALDVTDFTKVQKANSRTAPDDPISIVLPSVSIVLLVAGAPGGPSHGCS